jgi:hypothetical protein
MKIDITTPAIIFPAISLLMLVYTNKFLAISSVIRQLVKTAVTKKDEILCEETIKQINNLKLRIIFLKITQIFGLGSIFSCLLSIISLLLEWFFLGNNFFIFSLIIMMLSIIFAFIETLISGNALTIELEKLEK